MTNYDWLEGRATWLELFLPPVKVCGSKN
jgi:hypothetical protein